MVNDFTNDFRRVAREHNWFASGSAATGYRVAVRNVTQYRSLLAFVSAEFPTAKLFVPTSYPALVAITQVPA